MQKFINWLSKNFAPKVNKITRNVWIQSIQSAIMAVLPMVFVGSLITVTSIIKNYIPSFPDLSPIGNYSFGLIGLFIAFLMPYTIMEKKKLHKSKLIAGITGAALFLMFLKPEVTDAGAVFNFYRFGAEGMLVSLIAGLFVGVIMNAFAKFSFFKGSTAIPDFVCAWFDSMLPIFIVLLTGWIAVYALNLDFYQIIVKIFQPFAAGAETLPGFMFLCFIPVFFYSLGISGWVTAPITLPIMYAGIAANAAAVAAGGAPTHIFTYEVVQTGWITIGGQGGTLALAIFMVMSKSKRIKSIGKAVIGPSILNINEPVIFGAPIAWNPFLMIPMWLNSIIPAAIVWIALHSGLVTIPSKVFNLWYLPFGISTFMVNQDVRGLVLLAVVMAVMALIWFPFFKAYEAQEIKAEASQGIEY